MSSLETPFVTKKASRDIVSPHKLALLALIREFCIVKTQSQPSSFPPPEGSMWTHTNQQQRNFATTMLKLIQSPDMDLKKLDELVHPLLHPQTHQMFIDRLRSLRQQGVAEILDYIHCVEGLLIDPPHPGAVVHRSSVLGLYLRRMILAFEKLSFAHVTKLYNKFCQYFDDAFLTQTEGENMCGIETSVSSSLDLDADKPEQKSEEEEAEILATQKQAEFFLARQAALLQKNEKDALSPPQLQQKLQELLRGNPDLAEAYYLSFLNSLRVKEYCGAIESLYHHFDKSATILEPKPNALIEETSKSFRYSALNLGILHAKFGHREEAIAAVKEALMMAQENNDNICLQHCLSWLYRLTPDPELVERSISKSGELSLWALTSIGIQNMSRMKSFSSTPPIQVFELMAKSDILNCHHSLTELMESSYAQRAALWAFYGNSSMANLNSQLLLQLNTSDPVMQGVYQMGEGTCIALRNTAWTFALQGLYTEAFEILAHAKDVFPAHSSHAHIWMLCEQCILFERALHNGRWQAANTAVSGIMVLDSQEGQYRKAQLLLQQRLTDEANQLIDKLLTECKEKQNYPAYVHIRFLLLKAQVYICSAAHSFAIPHLMESLALAKKHHLVYYEALTRLYIIGVQLSLDLPSLSQQLLDETVVTILAHGSLYDSACCHLLSAKCAIALAKQEQNGDQSKWTQVLTSASQMVGKAIEQFSAIEALYRLKDAYYWQAMVFNELGNREIRNKAAREFKILDQQLGQSRAGLLIP